MRSFPTWKTVTLGKFKSCENYLAAAEAKGHEIGTYAAQILPKIEWAQEEIDDELVLASGRDFGLVREPTFRELVAAAATFSLYPCVAEDGPATRDQYLDQPVGQWYPMAMDPVADSDLDPKVFLVGRGSDGVSLRTNYVRPWLRYGLDPVWVWSRRPPAASADQASVALDRVNE